MVRPTSPYFEQNQSLERIGFLIILLKINKNKMDAGLAHIHGYVPSRHPFRDVLKPYNCQCIGNYRVLKQGGAMGVWQNKWQKSTGFSKWTWRERHTPSADTRKITKWVLFLFLFFGVCYVDGWFTASPGLSQTLGPGGAAHLWVCRLFMAPRINQPSPHTLRRERATVMTAWTTCSEYTCIYIYGAAVAQEVERVA